MLLTPMSEQEPGAENTPFLRMGGEVPVSRLAHLFYDRMEQDEPELAQLHPLDDAGKIVFETRERFRLFLIGWLGGPQDYMALYGHPRLRMRHGHVPIGLAMRDAWMRAMTSAFSDLEKEGFIFDEEIKAFTLERLASVADFLRNRPG